MNVNKKKGTMSPAMVTSTNTSPSALSRSGAVNKQKKEANQLALELQAAMEEGCFIEPRLTNKFRGLASEVMQMSGQVSSASKTSAATFKPASTNKSKKSSVYQVFDMP